MNPKIKVLAIAPYESMAALLETVASDFPQIELSVHIGDLDSGVKITKSAFQSNYDLILSRGGTAKRLRQAFSLPVIEIGVSCYDVLRTLQLANAHSGHIAVVGFKNIVEEMSSLKELLHYKIDIFAISSAEEAASTLQSVADNGYSALLCDMVSHTTAMRMGINSFLISSGAESIRMAMLQAATICDVTQVLRAKNEFLHTLLQSHSGDTVVFDRDEKLVYSTLDPSKVGLLDCLVSKIQEVPDSTESKLVVQFRNLSYSINAHKLSLSGEEYFVFHFTVVNRYSSSSRIGLRYDNRKQVEEEYLHGVYSVVEFDYATRQLINQFAASPCTVLMMGEVGTGKGHAARMLYLNGIYSYHPFIEIDCQSIKPKTWDYLTGHHSSPLFSIENTLYIKNIEALSPEHQNTLLTLLSTGYASKQNYTIVSVSTTLSNDAGRIASKFLRRLECQSLSLLPLRGRPELIEQLVQMHINHTNLHLGKQVSGIEPRALRMLCTYQWPQNYIQLSRVMERIVAASDNHIINADVTREALHREMLMLNIDAETRTSLVLDLSRPLSEINREIAQMVLDANNGNNTMTAESLGISRSTLWRMLKK
jgi:transcriptional regulator with PAS, ATPase and Fis domain